MVKVLKILGNTLLFSWELILIALILVAFGIRSPQVQTYLAKDVSAYFSKELNTTIKIDEVEVIFFDRVALDGVLLLDQKGDTIAGIKTLYATFANYDLEKKNIKLSAIELDGGTININRAKETGYWNFKFLADYFASNSPESNSKPFDVYVKRLDLSNINFAMDDNRKEVSSYGMDYNHIGLKHLYLNTDNISIENSVIQTTINHLSFQERCGFNINDLTGKLYISPTEYRVRELNIKTNNSELKIPKFALITKESSDFSDFVNKVRFEAELKETRLNLKDITYFVPSLAGMHDEILISTKVSDVISKLVLHDFDLKFGKRSHITGDLRLPDFADINKAYFNEKFDILKIDVADIENFNLPNSSKTKNLKLGEIAAQVELLDATNLRVKGTVNDLVISSTTFKTGVGGLAFDKGIHLFKNKKDQYVFEKAAGSSNLIEVDNLNLGKLLNNKTLGFLSGNFDVLGFFDTKGDFGLSKINGQVNHLDLNGYRYQNISISDASFNKNILIGVVEVNDPNLKLTYNGEIDLNKQQRFNFDLNLDKAYLSQLGISRDKPIFLEAIMHVDISGTNINNYSGTVLLDELEYKEGDLDLKIPTMDIAIVRGIASDAVSIRSNVLDLDLNGKIDANTIADNFMSQFNQILPALFPTPKGGYSTKANTNKFEYSVTLKEIEPFLAIFAPELSVSNGTQIQGKYDGLNNDFNLALTSSKIEYQKRILTGIQLNQSLVNGQLLANLSISDVKISDSIQFKNLGFRTSGSKNELNSVLEWNPDMEQASKFTWDTKVNGSESFDLRFDESTFFLKGKKWTLRNNSAMNYKPKNIEIKKFKISYGDQFVMLDGVASDNPDDRVKAILNDVKLEDFNDLLSSTIAYEGLLNGQVFIKTPFSGIELSGGATLQELFINKVEVGDITIDAEWDKPNKAIVVLGDLVYKNNKTLKFDGNYYFERTEDVLDFNVSFDHTDIRFTSAFLQPEVVSNIKGSIDGTLTIQGTPKNPDFNGKIALENANAKIGLLGVNFGLDGKLKIVKDGFQWTDMILSDQEGNAGTASGAVYHTDFTDWNYDISANLSENPFQKDKYNRLAKLKHFLVMDTKYKEGDIYYGKAYITGDANIFGTTSGTEITVHAKTEKNTKINFPLYGRAELTDNQIITWNDSKKKDTVAKKINLSTVTLDLNFDVTEDAKVKLIMSDKTGEEINADGSGELRLTLDQFGNPKMTGTYTLNKGDYNLTLGQIKQLFLIEKGGTIVWSGDPLGAIMNVRAYQLIPANINVLSDDPAVAASGKTQNIVCLTTIKGPLTTFKLGFELEAPSASTQEKQILDAATKTEAEKERLAVSLMILKRFISTNSAVSGSGTAADILEQQVKSALDQIKISEQTKLGVDLQSNSASLGVSQALFNDRVIISGSFGVEANKTVSGSKNTPVGNVSVEYLVNDDGTFRINAFNKSNDNSVIAAKSGGSFVQGAGIVYREDFNGAKDFKLLRRIIGLFKRRSLKLDNNKRKRTPLPPQENPPTSESPVILPATPAEQNTTKTLKLEN